MKPQLLSFLALSVFLFAGCKKDSIYQPATPPQGSSSLAVNINYAADDVPLIAGAYYRNDTGNLYQVTKVEYYISQLSLIKEDSSKIQILAYHYSNSNSLSNNSFTINDIPDGNYIGICFNIGLDSAHNVTDCLPHISDNDNMYWPVPMGGGYHFMKFEGYFVSGDSLPGFLMHLGTNMCLVKENPIYTALTFNHNRQTLNMTMNLNEWFRTPNKWDLNACNRTMSDMMAMQKLAANGVDVFHLKN